MLEKTEASAGFAKLDLKIQGRRRPPSLAYQALGLMQHSIKSSGKQAEPPHSSASQEAEGAAARRTFILSVPQLRCWGAEGATEAADVPAVPMTPTGAW